MTGLDTRTGIERPPRPVVRLPARRRGVVMRIGLPSLALPGGADALALGAIALFLTGFGLLMVLSASSVEEGATGDPFASFLTQGAAAVIGVGAMLVIATRVRAATLPRIAPFVFFPAVALQVVTALFGVSAGGNRNWLSIGGVSLQPSELVKVGLILALAAFFTNRRGEELSLKRLAPVLLMSGAALGAVYLGHDLGTTAIIALIVVAGLWFGGVRLPVLLLPGAVSAALLWSVAHGDGSRVGRLSAWSGGCSDLLGACWQSKQAEWALANGGLTGVGIGGSVSKWFWLPEADNDFIGAVVGEETGLLGLVVLVACFVALAVVLLRVGGGGDRFARTMTGMGVAWLVGQAFANLGVVVGLLPVFGVPLPFVSAGGTSLVANLVLVGCLMAVADSRRRDAPAPAPHPDHPAGRGRPAAR